MQIIVQKNTASNNVNYKNPEFPIFNHDFTIQRFLEPEKNGIIVPRAKISMDSFSGGPIYIIFILGLRFANQVHDSIY